MFKKYLSFLAIISITALSTLAFAQDNPCGEKGTVFYVNDPMGRNNVTFKSSAPLEDIIGTTNKISGHIVFDPDKPERGHAELTVPVTSLNTGIPLRDEHLRGADWLDAESFPEISLVIDKVKSATKVKSMEKIETYDLVVAGVFSLHGKSKNIEFPARITYLKETEQTKKRLAGDILAARATFQVSLADFGIAGPAGAGLIGSKVGETIEIEVSVMGSTGSTPPAGKPCSVKAKK